MVEQPPEAVLDVGGWEAVGAEGLQVLELGCPFSRSALDTSLLLSTPGKLPPRVFCGSNVNTW